MKLTPEKQQTIVKKKQKGLRSSLIANQLELSKRRVEQVWAYWVSYNKLLPLNRAGKKPKSRNHKRLRKLILHAYRKSRQGATYIAKYLRDKQNIYLSHNYIHNILVEEGIAMPNPRKQQRRKPWVRYERNHSLSAVHLDWHYNSALEKWICVVLDDASRKVIAGGEYDRSSGQHCIDQIKEALSKYGHIRPIREVITDHGPQFFANKKGKGGKRGLTEFQEFLKNKGIKHILCRYKHPQSNGKIEKWFDCYDKHRHVFSSFEEFVEWYNRVRPHGSLDMSTPEEVFWEKLQGYVLGGFLKWVET